MVTGRLVALGTARTYPVDPLAPPAPHGTPGWGVPVGGGGVLGVAMVMGGGCHGDGAGDEAAEKLMEGEGWERSPLTPRFGVGGAPGALGTVPGASWTLRRGTL